MVTRRFRWLWVQRTPLKPCRFRYLLDPVFLVACLAYALNRLWLKPCGVGGWFSSSYLNDVLCLPIWVPVSLRLQRAVGARLAWCYPRLCEILLHWVVFSVLFEIVLPLFPQFKTTADPMDVLAYFVGGAAAWLIWRSRSAARNHRRRTSWVYW